MAYLVEHIGFTKFVVGETIPARVNGSLAYCRLMKRLIEPDFLVRETWAILDRPVGEGIEAEAALTLEQGKLTLITA